jgi:hypothetical protein
LPNQAVAKLQRLVGNRATAGLVAAQRQVAPATSAWQLDGEWVSTYADLARWYRTRLARLQSESSRMAGEGVFVPLPVGALVAASGPEVARLQGLGTGALEDDALGRASDWLFKYEDAFTGLDMAYARAAAANLERSATGLEGAQRELTETAADLRDQLRRAMIAGDENAILATADLIQDIVDTALVFKDDALQLRRTSTAMLIEELKWLGRGTPPSARWLPRVLNIVDQVNKAYDVLAGARAAYSVAMGEGISQPEQARQAIDAMAPIVSATATLLGASASFTVYVNVYIGPMASLAVKLIAKLENMVQEQNLRYMQEGEWDLVTWWVEPTSSKAMFDYLRQVMRAPDSGAIPTPPDAVAEVFLKRRGALAAGAGQEVPTKGAWFWRRLDDEQVKRWLFSHRREVWSMFFGSAQPPR